MKKHLFLVFGLAGFSMYAAHAATQPITAQCGMTQEQWDQWQGQKNQWQQVYGHIKPNEEWQQIVDLFVRNQHMPLACNERGQILASSKEWDQMLAAIECGDFAEVQRLMPRFGSSSAVNRYDGNTLLKEAQYMLIRFQSN
jgi:hypothetical protein